MPIQQDTYWLPGFELSKAVVLQQIRFMLGPGASARPYSHQGSDGFMITGSRLTEAQITDLKRQSREHERQRARRMNGQDEANIHGLVSIRPGRRSPMQENNRGRHYR